MEHRGSGRAAWLLFLGLSAAWAQPRAILVDGAGPWRDSQWTFTVSQFSSLLADAGYSVQVVSPVDLPSEPGDPSVLLAVPSLESLPYSTYASIAGRVEVGCGLMASGGEPFRNPLYLTPDGRWVDSNTYAQATGAAPPGGYNPPPIPTISPAAREQFTTSYGVRVPVPRGRGLFNVPAFGAGGRYRVIGDLLAPAATLYFNNSFFQSLIVWLPWPQLFDPLRGELVEALAGAWNRLFFASAGADQVVWIPGETVTGAAMVVNAGTAPVQASLQWSISGASGVNVQFPVSFSLAAGETRRVPLSFGKLPMGDFTLSFRLMLGSQEADRMDSPLRVLDPTLSRQPDQKIRVVNGAFTAGGRHLFLRGVNYWPRYIAGIPGGDFNGQSWLEAGQYDPDVVEADLSEIASLGFNLVQIQFSDFEGFWAEEGRALIDFLERCRTHGIWVQVALRTTLVNAAYGGQISPTLENYIQAGYLPGNDRVFAYELLWEPMVGTHDHGGQGRIVNGAIEYNTGRMVLDPDWRAWVNDQYGSAANAEKIWGFAAPRDANGQLTNPLDDQMQNDGPWRVMVAAYRRFLEDYLGRNLGAIARQIRRSDPDALLTYRNWTTMTAEHNANTGYDIGTAAAYLDFFSPERYAPVLGWPDARAYGLVTAYSRYRNGGKPVLWAEFGADIGANGGTAGSRAAQAAVCDTMMRLVADDGSDGASVWWWPGGYAPIDGTDFGIVDPDGTPRVCAKVLAQWNATFAAAAPDATAGPAATVMVDRDADARGSYGLFLNQQGAYVQARQGGQSVLLADAGTGTDTATMPLVQVGNAAYAGTGPLKFANGDVAEMRVVCPGLDATVENGSTVAVASGTPCQVTPTVVNTGEAQWLPATAAAGGVALHTNAGDAAVTAAVDALQRTAVGPVTVTSPGNLIGRLRIAEVGDFGEVLSLALVTDPNSAGSCAIALSTSGSVSAPAAGATGTVQITTAFGCGWSASSTEPWLIVSPASGAGSGAATYTVAANYGPARQATMEVAGRLITVRQDGAQAAAAATVTLSSGNVSFGNQGVRGSSAAQAVKVTNTGATAAVFTASVGGVDRGDFSETNDCGAGLAPGQSCTVLVQFSPIATGPRAGALFVSGNVVTAAAALAGVGIATGPAPEIQSVVDSWGYSAGIAPGLWVTILGANLGGAPRTWDLDGVQEMPIAVGGTTVTFNGSPAALLYVSPTQINALVPASIAPGSVQVVVQVNGVNSAPFVLTARPTQPAVYAPAGADGTFYVTAALAGTATLVGNSATDPRVTRPVYSGDTLDLYMIGLGATADPAAFVTDRVFAGAFPVSAAVTATVGGEAAQVLFAGLTAPGLYLVRIVVPGKLAAGPQPLVVSAGGVASRGSVMLTVGSAAASSPQSRGGR